jgi:cytidylate kinase
LEQALARVAEQDRNRHRFLRYFFGDVPLQAARYALVINTGRVPIDHGVAAVLALIRGDWSSGADLKSARQTPDTSSLPRRRVLTLARELGAGDTGFARTLGDRLGLRVYDRELLEQEAARLGASQDQLEQVDEQPASLFQRLRPGSLAHRYHEVLGQLMSELAARGDVLLVGRGGSRFLRDLPQAFHVRLVAPMEIRLRRVMEHRWLREDPAQQLIAKSDSQRCAFYATYFGADWSDPVEYHMTLNSGRLGPATVDLVAFAATLHWADNA